MVKPAKDKLKKHMIRFTDRQWELLNLYFPGGTEMNVAEGLRHIVEAFIRKMESEMPKERKLPDVTVEGL